MHVVVSQVLIRCDLNVPLDGKKITDDTRIRASVPTIKYLLEKGARVAISSHLGRPKGGPEDKFSLGPCATRLSELLGLGLSLRFFISPFLCSLLDMY